MTCSKRTPLIGAQLKIKHSRWLRKN
uniref:Uncharacterized protein n=1 Tax=Arundo donax TaxID=35708 RepID=A0A0A8ZQY5_ARUDO